jgi:hypothetical protein
VSVSLVFTHRHQSNKWNFNLITMDAASPVESGQQSIQLVEGIFSLPTHE